MSQRVSKEEEAIFAALTAPLVVDIYGNLYALRDDGATINIGKPRLGKNKGFFPPLSNAKHKCVATNEKVYCLLRGQNKYLIDDGNILPPFYNILPDYPPMFRLQGQQQIDCVLSNSSRELACIKMTDKSIEVVVLSAKLYALDGWLEGDAITIVGMKPRSHKEGASTFTHKWGAGMIVRASLDSGKIISSRDDRKCVSGIQDKMPEEYGLTGKEKFEVECWLGVFWACQRERGLIGGIRDYSVFDDGWTKTEKPGRSDFVLTGIYGLQNDAPVLQQVLFPYTYVQVLSTHLSDFIYLLRWPHKGDFTVKELCVLKCSSKNDNAAEPRSVSVSGVGTEEPLSYFAVWHDERVGYYGCLATRIELLNYKSYLIRSSDGVHWSAIHPLAPMIENS